MADTQQQRQQHYNQFNHPTTSDTTIFPSSSSSSASQLLPLAIILPLGGLLLVLSGVTLALTLTGIVVTARLFVIFSPVLPPAVLAVAGFLTAGAFGVTGISSFAWLAGYLRGSRWPERLEHAKRRAGEVVGHVAKMTKKAAESAVSKSQEVGQTGQSKARDDGKAQEQEMGQKEKRKAREERRARKSESSGFYATAG